MGEQNFSLKWSGSDIPAIAMTVTDIVHGLGIAVHVKQKYCRPCCIDVIFMTHSCHSKHLQCVLNMWGMTYIVK